MDWIWKLEDMRHTTDFDDTFGRDAKLHGLIIIGKNMQLDDHEKRRKRWRTDHLLVDSKKIDCHSFDELRDDMKWKLDQYGSAIFS